MIQTFASSDYISVDGKRFDVLKFILAIFVVGIHTLPIDFWLRPLFRTAVPLFFIMSSYFFFLKQSKISDLNEKRKSYFLFVKRIILLYLFWTIVLLPYIVYSGEWYKLNILTILHIFKSFFISGIFPASWYLTSTILSISVIWCLSKYCSNRFLLFIGFLFYVCCCLTSNYFAIYEKLPCSIFIYKSYSFIFGKPCNSFLSALFFIVIGKIFAENKWFLSNKILIVLLLSSLSLLFVEAEFIKSNRLNLSKVDYSDDCFFSLVPLCVSSFMLLGQNFLTISINTVELRHSSTIIYCSHFTISSLLCGFCLSLQRGLYLFSTVMLISCFVSCLIYLLRSNCNFTWLNYAH